MEVSIGLDIGIASCGWSVINSDNGHIEDLGVRLFTARNSDNNLERRTNRGHRRLLRRRTTRLNDAKKLLNEVNFQHDSTLDHTCPYEIRVKGMSEKLTRGEIYRAVTHIIKKRGISYLDENSLDAGNEGKSFKDEVTRNALLLKEKTPAEIQLNRLKEVGRVKSGINPKGEYQLNIFTVDSYAKELEKILRKQMEFYPEIDEEFIQKFISKEVGVKSGLVYRKRPYYHGPGNAANNSEYGRWAEYKINGVPAKNIFEQLIGTDMMGKLRASNLSLTAQKYNLLNDLNNLSLPRENKSVTPQEKSMIINYFMNNTGAFGYKKVAELLGYKTEEIKGWRVDTKDKPEIHTLKFYRKWCSIFGENGIELNDIPVDVIDTLASIITLNTDLDAVINTIDLELPFLDDELKTIIFDNFNALKQSTGNKAWHSFSLDTLNLLIPELLNTNDEQNTILERLGLKKELRSTYSHLDKIPVKEVIENIYNPTVSKSVKQSLNVLNALIKKYGKENISYVTIEMPRDKNEDDQIKTIKKIQKDNLERKDKSKEYFLNKSGWDETQFEFEVRKPAFAKKLLYYYEQDGKCAYSGKTIEPFELLSGATEIDHVIPLSISLDDSINNKVLVRAEANQEKGQRSPYQAFMDGAKMGQTWEEYVTWVESQNYKKYKKRMLLETRDIFDPEVRGGFVARNLNDTRYASRIVLNTIQSIFYQSGTKVRVVNGSFTHTLRKKWGDILEKTRETHYHHAVDATLCAVSPYVRIDRYAYHQDEDGKKYMIDQITGEAIGYSEFKKLDYYSKKTYQPKWDNFIQQLETNTLYPRIKFSHQVDRKMNRKVSDATLYSTREKKSFVMKKGKEVENTDTYVIGKIKDIYSEDGWNDFVKRKDQLLMKEIDPNTYDLLIKIADEYPEFIEKEEADGKVKRVKASPFKVYCDKNDLSGIQKYSKKGNGPIIRSLKYYDKKVGYHLNITKDQQGNSINQTSNGRKVILNQLTPFRTDVYYDEKKDLYILVGIKYSDCKYIKGKYGIEKGKYIEILKNNKIESIEQFCFSLYKNDFVSISYNNETFEGLFSSKNNTGFNYCEIKPIDKSKWTSSEQLKVFGKIAGSGQFIKSIKSGMKIRKVNVDYLGNKYYVEREELKNIIE